MYGGHRLQLECCDQGLGASYCALEQYTLRPTPQVLTFLCEHVFGVPCSMSSFRGQIIQSLIIQLWKLFGFVRRGRLASTSTSCSRTTRLTNPPPKKETKKYPSKKEACAAEAASTATSAKRAKALPGIFRVGAWVQRPYVFRFMPEHGYAGEKLDHTSYAFELKAKGYHWKH